MIREAGLNDLDGLLKLYTNLHDNQVPEINKTLLDLWYSIQKDSNHHIIIAEKDGEIVSSCVLFVIPNLTHNQRPYALIENVVTDEKHRMKGYATACLDFAKKLAVSAGCYKIMLLTGSKLESTLKFYENAGYNRNDKTAFIQWLNP